MCTFELSGCRVKPRGGPAEGGSSGGGSGAGVPGRGPRQGWRKWKKIKKF